MPPPTTRSLREHIDRATTQPMLSVFAFAWAIAVGATAVAYVLGRDGPLDVDRTRVVVGDFLAFLTGGAMLWHGDGAALYDSARQLALQQSLAGIALPQWQPYLNPPLLALLLSPLAALPFDAAFKVFALAMLLAGLAAVWALGRSLDTITMRGRRFATLAALVLGFHPILMSLPGRQNTALTLALLCGALLALQRGRPMLGGVLIGLLSYKPQMMPALALLLLLLRCWPALGGMALALLAHYGLGALIIAPDWPLALASHLAAHRPLERAMNGGTHFSVPSFFDHWIGNLPGSLLTLAVLVMLAGALWRWAPRARPGEAMFPLLWSMVMLAGLMAAPHLQHYDFGLIVLPVCVALDIMQRQGMPPGIGLRTALAGVYLGYPAIQAMAPMLGLQPLTLLSLAVFGWLCTLSARCASRA